MNALVVYDSNYGNTKIIADTLAKALGGSSKHVKDVETDEVEACGLLVVGSPINGWMATEATRDFLGGLEHLSLEDKPIASFDTRMQVFYHGDAMAKIQKRLLALGGKVTAPPMSFFVKDKDGPLLDGEEDKAQQWAKDIKLAIK